MAKNLILSSEEQVVCPSCGKEFPIENGITRQTIKHYETEYQRTLDERAKELEQSLSEENESRIKKLQADTESKLKKEFAEQRALLEEDLETQKASIKTFRANEIKLLREQKQLAEDKQNFELQMERELRDATKEIEKKVTEAESQRFELREAEYKKKLDDALKTNVDLTRKLLQGSQQLQGEILELQLEGVLRETFKHDNITEISKGVRGADIIQSVCTRTGQTCGTIIWEAKRTQNWSEKWVAKVKDDCLAQNADIAVIVTTNLPKDCDDLFTIRDGVWVCSETIVRPVAETLREILIQTSVLKLQSEGSTRKADLIYSYLGSTQFAQNMRSVFQNFVEMETDLNREKRAMLKTWKKREVHLERAGISMTNVVAQIQSLAQNTLPELEDIPELLLPGADDLE